jgi:hypothetical protein
LSFSSNPVELVKLFTFCFKRSIAEDFLHIVLHSLCLKQT